MLGPYDLCPNLNLTCNHLSGAACCRRHSTQDKVDPHPEGGVRRDLQCLIFATLSLTHGTHEYYSYSIIIVSYYSIICPAWHPHSHALQQPWHTEQKVPAHTLRRHKSRQNRTDEEEQQEAADIPKTFAFRLPPNRCAATFVRSVHFLKTMHIWKSERINWL